MGKFSKAMKGLMRSFDLDTFAGTWGKAEMYAYFNVLDGIDSSAVLNSLQAFLKNVWVHRCTNVIASAGAMLPIEVWKGTAKVDKHPFIDFMTKPNTADTQEQLLYRTIAVMMLYGECFWWIIRKGSTVTNNMPESVWIIDPRLVEPELTNTFPQQVYMWKVQTPFGNLRIFPDDMAHFRIPHPNKPFRGCSPIEAAGISISADVAAARWNYRFFRNSALPVGILSTDQPLTDPQARQVRKRWEEVSQGEDNAHRIQVTYRGLKWTPMQFTRRDMEFKDGRDQNRSEICAAYGVPGLKLGLLDGATYANSDQQKELFWTQTMLPLLRLIEATLEKSLIRDPSYEVYLNTDNVEDMRSIIARKVETAVKMFSIGWPLNLIDRRLDIGMGDVEWGDEGFLAWTLQPARLTLEAQSQGTEIKPIKPVPGAAGDPNADPNLDPKTPPDGTKAVPVNQIYEHVRSHVDSWAKGSVRAKIVTAIEGLVDVSQDELLPNEQPPLAISAEAHDALLEAVRKDASASSVADANVEDVLRDLRGFETPVVPAYREITIFDRILNWHPRLYVPTTRDLSDDVDAVIQIITDDNGLLKKIEAKYTMMGFAVGVNQANELLGVSLDLTESAAAKEFLAAKELKITGVNDTTREQIREALYKGLDGGLSNDDLADNIVDIFDFAKSRARTIARTETASSSNTGRVLSFKENGATKHAWLTAEDDRVRETHAEIDGEEVDIGENFPVVDLEYPGDPQGAAEEVINCRCVTVPVFSDAEAKSFVVGFIKGKTLEQRAVIWRKMIAGPAMVEREFTSRLKKYFRRQQANVLAELKKRGIGAVAGGTS